MPQIDPYGLNLAQLFIEALMFRITPADPQSTDSITIKRDVFDQLVAVLDSVRRVTELGTVDLKIFGDHGKFIAISATSLFSETFRAEGRTILEAISKAQSELWSRLNRLID